MRDVPANRPRVRYRAEIRCGTMNESDNGELKHRRRWCLLPPTYLSNNPKSDDLPHVQEEVLEIDHHGRRPQR